MIFSCASLAQPARKGPATVAVLPFENKSGTPGLEWIGDSFPEILGERLSSESLYVVRREERVLAFDRVGIPTNIRPSRATCYRLAQELGVDYLIVGKYEVNGGTLKATAQLLRMSTLRLTPEVTEEGPLPKVVATEAALAWDLLGLVESAPQQKREQFLNGVPDVRVDAFENYMRGVIAPSQPDQIRHLKEAVRLSPGYSPAQLQLGKIYYDTRDYAAAVGSLKQVSKNDPSALEANFYLGLAAYYAADLSRAENAFSFLTERFPAAEVYNNLGVIMSRREKKAALDNFRKAVEANPQEPDYRFNLAVNLYRQNDLAGAVAQLREMLAMRSNDVEAQELLANITRAQENGSAAPRTFPLERIKTDYDDAGLHGVTFAERQTGSNAAAGSESRPSAH